MARFTAASPAVFAALGVASTLVFAFLLGRAWLSKDRKERERQTESKHHTPLSSTNGNPQDILDSFDDACSAVEASAGALADSTRLRFYGLFKQAKEGDCQQGGPPPWNPAARAKWKAWKAHQGVSPDTARELYVQLALDLKILDDKTKLEDTTTTPARGSGIGPVHSKPLISGKRDTSSKSKGDHFCCLAAEGELELIKKALDEDPSLVAATGDGRMTALHFAADRGHANIVKLLIEYGADINHLDDCGETPLHVAIAAEQPEIVSLLLTAGAETSVKNNEGLSCSELLRQHEINQN